MLLVAITHPNTGPSGLRFRAKNEKKAVSVLRKVILKTSPMPPDTNSTTTRDVSAMKNATDRRRDALHHPAELVFRATKAIILTLLILFSLWTLFGSEDATAQVLFWR